MRVQWIKVLAINLLVGGVISQAFGNAMTPFGANVLPFVPVHMFEGPFAGLKLCESLLDRPKASPAKRQLITDFYDDKLNSRFFDSHLGLRFDHVRLEVPMTLVFEGQQIYPFQPLYTSKTGTSYASIFNLAIITTKKMEVHSSLSRVEALASALTVEASLPSFLASKDINAAAFFGEGKYLGDFYVFKEYVPGPTFEQFNELFETGKITEQQWSEGALKYIRHQNQLNQLENDPDFLAFKEKHSYNEESMALARNSVYYEGQWVVVEP